MGRWLFHSEGCKYASGFIVRRRDVVELMVDKRNLQRMNCSHVFQSGPSTPLRTDLVQELVDDILYQVSEDTAEDMSGNSRVGAMMVRTDLYVVFEFAESSLDSPKGPVPADNVPVREVKGTCFHELQAISENVISQTIFEPSIGKLIVIAEIPGDECFGFFLTNEVFDAFAYLCWSVFPFAGLSRSSQMFQALAYLSEAGFSGQPGGLCRFGMVGGNVTDALLIVFLSRESIDPFLAFFSFGRRLEEKSAGKGLKERLGFSIPAQFKGGYVIEMALFVVASEVQDAVGIKSAAVADENAMPDIETLAEIVGDFLDGGVVLGISGKDMVGDGHAIGIDQEAEHDLLAVVTPVFGFTEECQGTFLHVTMEVGGSHIVEDQGGLAIEKIASGFPELGLEFVLDVHQIVQGAIVVVDLKIGNAQIGKAITRAPVTDSQLAVRVDEAIENHDFDGVGHIKLDLVRLQAGVEVFIETKAPPDGIEGKRFSILPTLGAFEGVVVDSPEFRFQANEFVAKLGNSCWWPIVFVAEVKKSALFAAVIAPNVFYQPQVSVLLATGLDGVLSKKHGAHELMERSAKIYTSNNGQ